MYGDSAFAANHNLRMLYSSFAVNPAYPVNPAFPVNPTFPAKPACPVNPAFPVDLRFQIILWYYELSLSWIQGINNF